MGVMEKVRYSEWAAPIVPVVKPDKSIRVCGDYKVTINSALEVDQHPLPKPEELFVSLSGGAKFTKLDLSRAYQQILLDDNSREYVTINAHKGLYRPTRLPFGVASASAIFQSKIEQLLQGIPMVVCRVDDILVSGKTDEEHLYFFVNWRDAAKEKWSAYTERFEHYTYANGIDTKDEKKLVSVFLAIVGSSTYDLLRNLVAPKKPAEYKFKELVDVLQRHFEPAPLIIAERFHFHKRDQHNFAEFLEQALRDRFVCGLKNSAIQKKLLTEKKLSWQGAVDKTKAMESADKQASNFKNSPASGAVNAIHGARPKTGNRNRTYQKNDKFAKPCFRCGGNYLPQTCKFKEVDCRFCKHKGHIERVCKKKEASADKSKEQRGKPVRYIDEDHDEVQGLFNIGTGSPEPSIVVPVSINGTDISMELDTGATVSVMSEQMWKDEFSTSAPLEPSPLKLKTYTGEHLKIKGQASVEVNYNGQNVTLPLQIVEGSGPALFGRNWLRTVKLDWGSIKKVTTDLESVISEHKELFKDELGTLKGVKAKLYIKPGSRPKFFKPRSVPHALKEGIESELTRLENMGVMEKVRYSEWAAPIVPVVKGGDKSSIRICGDYKVTINSALEVDQHPLPNPEELFVTLSGGEKFTKLDLSRAYQQIELDEESRGYVTINTHKGLFSPTRLPFGVASASAIFQYKIEQVLQGIPMVVCRVDDILVSGKSDSDHLSNLSEVLS